MKNLIVMLALAITGSICAQEVPVVASASLNSEPPAQNKKAPKNEIRLNIATAIAGLPEINYEGFVADNVGIGLAVAFAVESYEQNRLRAMFVPYARIYFQDMVNKGFFIEGNAGFVSQKGTEKSLFLDQGTEVKSYFKAGFGAAVGWKFLTKNNYVGELYLGLGRLFGENLFGAYPRLGITLGKRF